MWTAASPRLSHRVLVEPVVLGGLRVVADEVGRLLDLAKRLDPGLPDLDRHQAAVDHLALADQLGRALQDLEPLLPAQGEPRRLRLARGCDRVLDVLPGAGCEVAEDDVAIDRAVDRELTVTAALGARDEVPMVAVEERLRLGEARFVLGVELLVVGAERGVSDLEARLRLGRHEWEPRERMDLGTLRSV